MPDSEMREDRIVIFSGIEGAILAPDSLNTKEIIHALDHIERYDIPLILTSDKPIYHSLHLSTHLELRAPVICECGAALVIPSGYFNTDVHSHRTQDNWHIVEFGLPAAKIMEKLDLLQKKHGQRFECITEEIPGYASEDADSNKYIQREYSVAISAPESSREKEDFIQLIDENQLRLKDNDHYLIVTADHDEGTAVRYLTQLFREEFETENVNTIGIGATWMDAPTLYAVDYPVLVRLKDGSFDGRIGRRNMKFTRFPGQTGWNQALIALITGDEEQEG